MQLDLNCLWGSEDPLYVLPCTPEQLLLNPDPLSVHSKLLTGVLHSNRQFLCFLSDVVCDRLVVIKCFELHVG